MSRRATDKMASRLIVALVILAALSSVLASVIGYRAIVALDKFDRMVRIVSAAASAAESKSLLPEGY